MEAEPILVTLFLFFGSQECWVMNQVLCLAWVGMNVDSEARLRVLCTCKMSLEASKDVFLEAMPARRGSMGAVLAEAWSNWVSSLAKTRSD